MRENKSENPLKQSFWLALSRFLGFKSQWTMLGYTALLAALIFSVLLVINFIV